jgi:hypothetical protein
MNGSTSKRNKGDRHETLNQQTAMQGDEENCVTDGISF